MLSFFIVFTVSVPVFSFLLAGWPLRLGRSAGLDGWDTLLCTLGLAPGLISLFLYYLMVCFPGRGESFYLGGVVLLFLILGFLGRQGWRDRLRQWRDSRCATIGDRTPGVRRRRWPRILFRLTVLSILAACLWGIMAHVVRQPIKDHDVVQYAVMGRIYAQDRSIDFSGYRPHRATGFYSQILHAPSFSLLHTWESFMNHGLLGRVGDLFFRSLSFFYAVLILALMYNLLRKRHVGLALLGILISLSGVAFFLALSTYHIDSYRMFFAFVSWIMLFRSIEGKHRHAFLLLGIFSGLAAFAHSIGVIVAGLNCLVVFGLGGKTWGEKMAAGSLVSLTVLLFGGVHYVIDTFFGQGWIF